MANSPRVEVRAAWCTTLTLRWGLCSTGPEERNECVYVGGAGTEVASFSCHCPDTMLGNLQASNPAPTPSHTHRGRWTKT